MRNKNDSCPGDDGTSSSLPSDADRDREAEALAREAREAGIALISDHLDTHLQQNPDSSYVTWIATLHPENAQVTIDPRFFVPNNPWWNVYEEAQKTFPVAVQGNEQQEVSSLSGGDYELLSPSDAPLDAVQAQQQRDFENRNCSCHLCSPLEILIGVGLSLLSFFLVLLLEVAATFLYLITVIFYYISWLLQQGPMVLTGFFYGIFMSIYYLLGGVDSLFLLVSLLLSELVALLAAFACCLLGGCAQGQLWHQYIRRTCHLLRWAFRGNTDSAGTWFPPRLAELMAHSRADSRKEHEEGEGEGGNGDEEEALDAAADDDTDRPRRHVHHHHHIHHHRGGGRGRGPGRGRGRGRDGRHHQMNAERPPATAPPPTAFRPLATAPPSDDPLQFVPEGPVIAPVVAALPATQCSKTDSYVYEEQETVVPAAVVVDDEHADAKDLS